MTRKEELLALAARVEALTEPDRETDLLIHAHQTGKRWRWAEFGGAFGAIDPQTAQIAVQILPFDGTEHEHELHWADRDVILVPAYTACLNAAMSLVPVGCTISLNIGRDRQTEATLESNWDTFCGYAATPALALTAAALRALAEQEPC
jgi:hypothetical protein